MAVYTKVSDEELSMFISAYDIGSMLSFKGIAEGVENSNYLINTESDVFVLTLFEKRVLSGDLPYFLGLMDHLAERGIPCPTPVKGRDGMNHRELCGKPAAIISFLPGLWPKLITTSHCRALGSALAHMHLAGKDFQQVRFNSLAISDLHSLLEVMGRKSIDAFMPSLFDHLAEELEYLEKRWPTNLPTGNIHADLFPDNVFFKSGRLSGIIDFYFACTDYLAYDLGICLNAWCFEINGSFNATKARELLDAYSTTREFSNLEKNSLPVLVRGAAIRFILTRLFDWINTSSEALVVRKNPLEYLNKLRFHQRTKSLKDYGL